MLIIHIIIRIAQYHICKAVDLSEINTEAVIVKFGKIGAFRISEAVFRRFFSF